jgi:hypothetical protein
MRICTKKEDLVCELKNLKGYFLNRNYHEEIVDEGFKKAHHTFTHSKNAVAANHEDSEDESTPAMPVMVIPFHPTNPKFAHQVRTLWLKY